MNHKRRRRAFLRGATCLCCGLAKKMDPNKLSGKGHNRREMQLRERARETA